MAQNVLSITQLTEYIRGRLDDDPFLGQVAVRGEISNYKVYPSGHHYFTLKDEGAALKCVMFKGNAMRLRFRPDNGMKVIAMGKVTVYPRDGAYQLYCAAMAMDGVGDLYAAFEQLKKKLAAQGLFDPAHKKPLPKCPGTIGIVTSSAGAAVHDMLRILRKRYPLTNVRLLPVRVQGAEAPGEIAAAIRYANRYRLADLLIVGRGGGSIEDLWAFNDENLAYAIYNCKIPVISAVGHETDFTICDFVSDLRAPTPSAAAELAVPDTAELVDYYKSQKQYVSSMATLKLRQEYNALTELKTRLSVVSPQQRIFEYEKSLELCKTKIQHFVQETINKKTADITKTAAKLEGLNPVKILSRGYSIAEKDGRVVNSAKILKSGDEFTLRFSDGEIKAKATGE